MEAFYWLAHCYRVLSDCNQSHETLYHFFLAVDYAPEKNIKITHKNILRELWMTPAI